MTQEYSEALEIMRANPLSNWAPKSECSLDESFAAARIHHRFSQIKASKRFKFKRDDGFFCIGSCFAREVEDAIENIGLIPYTKTKFNDIIDQRADLFGRVEGVVGRKTAFLNKYNICSMTNQLEAVANEKAIGTSLLYAAGNEKFHDYSLSRFLKPVSFDECLERRSLILRTYHNAAVDAGVFVFTLGLCEAFIDIHSCDYLNIAPDPKVAKGKLIRFKFLSFEENLVAGRRLIKSVKKVNPEARIVLTVSPVPLDTTFTGHDIIVANSLAKSTLVCVAHELTNEFDDTFYFPSYEIVMNSQQDLAWLWDKKHVHEKMVKHIMAKFIEDHLCL